MSDQLKNIILAIGLAICFTWLTLYATDALNLQFDPDNYSTHTRILRMNPKVEYGKFGNEMIVIDDQDPLIVPTTNFFLKSNGISTSEFLEEVHIGDTVTYSIENESVFFSNPNQVQALSIGTKTYLALEHLEYKNSIGFRILKYSVAILMFAGILYNAVLMIRT
ncbi:hypothetical protein [Reichenbachiella sp.]|uniref:hypothetical protein n=1 Tax=Reichenbachiella sp. TaxID=2184521 RepID=UPI003B5B02CD